MIGKTLALAATLLLSTQVYAQTNQGGASPAQGVTSGPAAGSPTSMKSPQAGSLETKHQRSVLRNHSKSVRNEQGIAPATKRATSASPMRAKPTPPK